MVGSRRIDKSPEPWSSTGRRLAGTSTNFKTRTANRSHRRPRLTNRLEGPSHLAASHHRIKTDTGKQRQPDFGIATTIPTPGGKTRRPWMFRVLSQQHSAYREVVYRYRTDNRIAVTRNIFDYLVGKPTRSASAASSVANMAIITAKRPRGPTRS